MFNKKHFDHRLDLLELYLTVREPGTVKSADAYDGLRKLLVSANKGTQVHLAHLATLHRTANTADSLDPVRSKIDELMSQMGLIQISDPSQEDLYQVTGGKGETLVVDVPAYVSLMDDGSSRLVQQGVAHWDSEGSTQDTSDDSSEAASDDDVEDV